MKLIVQPDTGLAPTLRGIKKAKRSLDVLISRLDIEKSRSFGVITRNRRLLREAIKLFEDDFNRRPYTPTCERFVVSPENSRERLAAFIKGARKQLLIYDPKVSHPAFVRLLV